MRSYYDDNFGEWDGMDEPEMVEFYHKTQKQSVLKTCAGCGRKVRIKPEYDVCSACADKREQGGDF